MDKKEMTMEARLLLAFILMGLVLFGTQYFYKPAPAVTPASNTPGPANRAEVAKQAQAPPVPAPRATPGEMPGQVQADREETFAIETDLYRVTFSNRGAVVRSWVLKAYKDKKGQPLELVNQAG